MSSDDLVQQSLRFDDLIRLNLNVGGLTSDAAVRLMDHHLCVRKNRALAIYDTMQFISSEVATTCIGRAYSGGAVLLCCGHPGKRTILPHAKVMIHQPYGGVTGQTTDIQIQADQIIKAKRLLNEIIARHCKQPYEQVAKDGERDKYFDAQEAKAYGLVDEVASFPDKSKK